MYVQFVLRHVTMRHMSKNVIHEPISPASRRLFNSSSSSSNHGHVASYDEASASPFILQSKNYISEYESGIKLSTSLLDRNVICMEAEKKRIGQKFAETSPCICCEASVESHIQKFRENILSQVFTDNRTINEATSYILRANSKLFRPKLGFMVAEVLSEYLSRTKLLPLANNAMSHDDPLKDYGIYAQEQVITRVARLLQSYEIVHAGTLIHDDIVDDAENRRNQQAIHLKMGTKLSVLVGDVMLTRACSTVANLGSQPSTVRMAKALENLIKGELIEVEPSANIHVMLESYLRKIFLKTASLMAECCASIADIFGMDPIVSHKCYLIGLHVGMAFQIYDDLLDYRSHSGHLGKPALNDIASGLITMPLIFALPESKELRMILANGGIKSENVNEILSNVRVTNSFQRSHCAVMIHLNEVSKLLRSFDTTDVGENQHLSGTSQTLLRLVYDTLTRTTG